MVREAQQEEWLEVADVTKASYEQYADSADPEFWTMYEAGTRQTLLEDKDIVRIVAVEGGEIVASVVYLGPYEKQMGNQSLKNPYPEMRLLSVLPQFRHRGLGDKLIAACEKRAKEEGYSAITLHTTKLMTEAKAMYERRGYSRFEEIDFEPVPGFVVWGYIKEFQNGA